MWSDLTGLTTGKTRMRILRADDVTRAASMREMIDAMRAAFIELSAGRAASPQRLALDVEPHAGVTLVMPAYLQAVESLTVKIVSVHVRNPQSGLPLIHGFVLAIDPATGQARALIDGGSLTAMRTGAASGLAADLLARAGSDTAALFGAGCQAQTQLAAVCAVRKIRRAFIYAPHRTSVDRFIASMNASLSGVELIAAAAASAAVREADIICTATTSSAPVFDGADLKPGAHINAVGSFKPEVREIDAATIARASKVVVDDRASALAEAGDLIQAINEGVLRSEDIYAEIGEIAAGHRRGRESESEITFFKSVGNAVQDAAAAALITARAESMNLGVEIEL
jgi:ornithine cyclodeaminase/alanine dehydrogenase-like protein (mu-crystallin family)